MSAWQTFLSRGVNLRKDYQNLQFEEVKKLISSFSSFSLGVSHIMAAEPIHNRLQLQRQLDRIREALNLVVSYGQMPFSGIHDISEEVNLALKDGTLNGSDLLRIADQAYGIEKIKEYYKNAEGEYPEIGDLVAALNSCTQTSREINRCIGNDGNVNDNASSHLAAIRRQIKSLQASIAKKMAEFINRNSKYLQDNIQASRNDRSVVLVKNSFKNTVEGLQYGSSSTGLAVYVEPSSLVPLNNELQDLKSDEKEEIIRILFQLSQLVKKDGLSLLANTDTLGILDSLFAQAQWAKNNDGTVGQISEKDFIIKQGRHPLIDSSKVVANSYSMIDPVSIILITGPNTGGKTVSMKLIGLSALMFLSGMPILCQEAQIPLFDQIFCDIGDSQSISDDLSTFSGHIERLAEITRDATRKSLVILDELGSATDPAEGQAIASAVLEYLRQNEVYVVATTHFSKLKAYAKQYDDIMISSMEFDHRQLKPTYRYIENSIGQSNAIEIAKRYGIAEEIIDNAYEFKRQQQTDSDILLENLQQQIEEVRQQKEDLDKQYQKLRDKQFQYREDKRKLKEQQRTIIEEANEKAAQIVQQASDEAEEVIEELKKQKNYNINEVAKLKHQIQNIVPEAEEEIDGEISIGDYVRIGSTTQKGEIIEMDRKNAIVNCDGLKIKSKLANLVRIARPKEEVRREVSSRVVKSSNFSIELNLIGYRVEEALEALDKYLDQAVLANVPFVRIVHGMGTGALRTAIWNKLKTYRYVKKYEFAPNAEGSSGVTIVTFKE